MTLSGSSPEVLSAIIEAANIQRGPDHSDQLRDALNAVPDLERDQVLQIRLAVADAMQAVSSASGAGLLAIWLGASVEHGVDPEPTSEPILRTLVKWCGSITTADDDEDLDPQPDDETLTGCEYLGQGLVAHLARSPKQRDEFAKRAEVVNELSRVEHLAVGAMWVMELLRKCSGELIVMHAEHETGFRVEYKNLSNCFHLFTLLQGELAGNMPGSKKPSPTVIAAANGKVNAEVHDQAWWHYGSGNVPTKDLTGFVPGEASPDSIARIDGHQVLLLWSPILASRSWDSGFFAPLLQAAPPSVEIKAKLSRREIRQWREKLALPAL